jgi:hypothetical protein
MHSQGEFWLDSFLNFAVQRGLLSRLPAEPAWHFVRALRFFLKLHQTPLTPSSPLTL